MYIYVYIYIYIRRPPEGGSGCDANLVYLFTFFETSKRLRGQAPPAAGPALPPLFESKFNSKAHFRKRAESGAKRLRPDTPFRLKSPKQTQNDPQDPFWEVLWNTPWKKRRHQRPPGSPKNENKGPDLQSDRAGSIQTQFAFFAQNLERSSKMHPCVAFWDSLSFQRRIIWLEKTGSLEVLVTRPLDNKIAYFCTSKITKRGAKRR